MDDGDVLEALRQVVDPEVGIDVVELGLIYGVRIEDDVADVEMTMTSPACPLGEMLAGQARDAILGAVRGLRDARITLVWDPPWTPARMSSTAKQLLGW
jgi:metal-sulfur cluster biosynthetic enzyme